MKRKKAPLPDLENIIPILINVWRQMHRLAGPPDSLQTREFRSVVEQVKVLHKHFETGQPIPDSEWNNKDLMGGYLLYSWVVHYLQALSIMGELPQTPTRVLDLCSGAAPIGFAALRWGASEVVAVDAQLDLLKMGSQVIGKYGHPLSIRHWKHFKGKVPVEGTFDLICLGHGWQRMFPPGSTSLDQRQSFLLSLFDKLSPGGYLMLIQSSQLEINHQLLALRDRLVGKGIPVQAPCVWRGLCPALQSGSPCFAQRPFEKPHLIKEIQRAASINLSSLKMSYLILRDPKADWPAVPMEPVYRVVSPPVESNLIERFYLCGTDGKKSLESRLSQHPVESRAYEYLRRGDLIHIGHAAERGRALEVVEGTTVQVVVACGKPLAVQNQNQDDQDP